MGKTDQRQTVQTALGGVLAAGSLILLWLACLSPSGKAAVTAVAGLFPMAAALYAGQATGYLCWAAAGLLGLVLLPDKGIALMFLAFLGLYSVVKNHIESVRRLWLEWCLKLLFFHGELALFWFFLRALFMPEYPKWLSDHLLICCLGSNGAFVIYDIGLSWFVALLKKRLSRTGRGV